MFRCLLLGGLLASGALAQPGSPAATVKVAVATDVALGGTAGAFLGHVDGVPYVFKSNEPTGLVERSRAATGNVEAEYLVSRLFESLGVPTPRVRLVHIEGRTGLFSMSEFVGSTMGGQTVHKDVPRLWTEAAQTGRALPLDHHQARAVQVMDVWIGNADRNPGNLFLRESPTGLQTIPIDHNWSLVDTHQRPDVHRRVNEAGVLRDLVPSFAGAGAFGRARDAGTPANILLKTAFHASAIAEPVPTYSQFAPHVDRLRTTFTDRTLRSLLDELPAEIPAERRERIFQSLRWRRDHLESGLKSLVDSFPDRLEQRTPRQALEALTDRHTSASLSFLKERLLVPAGPGSKSTLKLDLVGAYRWLREGGVGIDQAREIVERGVLGLPPRLRASLGGPLHTITGPMEAQMVMDRAKATPVTTDPTPEGARRPIESRRLRPLFGEGHPDSGKPAVEMQELNWRYQQLDLKLARVRRALERHSASESSRLAQRKVESRLLGEQLQVLEALERIGARHGLAEAPRPPLSPYPMSAVEVERGLKRAEIAGRPAAWDPGVAPRPTTPRAAGDHAVMPRQATSLLAGAFSPGSLATQALLAATVTTATHLREGRTLPAAASQGLISLGTAEFLLGGVVAGGLGAAAGAALTPASWARAPGFAGGVIRALPSLALGIVAAELAVQAIREARAGQASPRRILENLDGLRTVSVVLGTALGGHGAMSLVRSSSGWRSVLLVGGGLAGGLLAAELARWFRGPGESTASPRDPGHEQPASSASGGRRVEANEDDLMEDLAVATSP